MCKATTSAPTLLPVTYNTLHTPLTWCTPYDNGKPMAERSDTRSTNSHRKKTRETTTSQDPPTATQPTRQKSLDNPRNGATPHYRGRIKIKLRKPPSTLQKQKEKKKNPANFAEGISFLPLNLGTQ